MADNIRKATDDHNKVDGLEKERNRGNLVWAFHKDKGITHEVVPSIERGNRHRKQGRSAFLDDERACHKIENRKDVED